MNPPEWRLLDQGALDGALSMALDVALLHAVDRGDSAPAIRLYGWSPPCLSLGRHQPVSAVDLDFCRRHGILVVRRPTGGRAVLHHLELTYSLVAPLDGAILPRRVQETYRRICGALVAGLAAAGVAAGLTPDTGGGDLPAPTSAVPCFKAPAGGEVVVGGRKLVGSAMRVHGGSVLQHGSILLDWDGGLQAGALGLPDDTSLRPFVTTVKAELGRPPDEGSLRTELAGALAATLGVRLRPAQPTSRELAAAEAGRGRYLLQPA
jgi:lipoate-protein ligase A